MNDRHGSRKITINHPSEIGVNGKGLREREAMRLECDVDTRIGNSDARGARRG